MLEKNSLINKNINNSGMFAGRDCTINNFSKSSSVLYDEIPKNVEGYVPRTDVKMKVLKMIKENEVLQMYGISGIGKTELMQDIAIEIEKDFDKVYYISVVRDEEIYLSQITALSSGQINILDKIKNNKVLIIIDNYNLKIDGTVRLFKEVNRTESKLIFISQKKSSCKIEHYEVEFMNSYEAISMFDNCTKINKSDNDFKSFIENIDKHPMTLQVLKNYIEDEDSGIEFVDFKDDLANIVRLEGETKLQHIKICEMIVGKYLNDLRDSFELIRYIDSNYIEKLFLKALIKSDIPSLTKRMLIKNREDHYYIHDIIKESINAVLIAESVKKNYIPKRKEIISYLETKIDSKLVDYYQFLAYNSKLINKLLCDVEGRHDKIVIYNLIITYANNRNLDEHISAISDVLDGNIEGTYFETKLIIEQYEMKIQKFKQSEKKEVVKKTILDVISKLENMTKLSKVDLKTKRLIKHHIGKLYNWIEEYEKAIKLFKEIINEDSTAYKTILQLCRAYRNMALIEEKNKKYEEKKSHINEVKTLISPIKFDEIPVSVYLEILTLIQTRPLNSKEIHKICLWNNFDYFSKISLLYSKNKIIEHIYTTMGILAPSISYDKPQFFKKWFEEIEHPVIDFANEKIIKAWIHIYSSEIKRRKNSKPSEKYSALVNEVISIWGEYKDLIVKNKSSNNKEFEYKPIIEMLIEVAKYDEAEKELKEVFRENNEWHRRYKSKILTGKEKYDEAEKELFCAMKIIEGKGNLKYVSAFYKDIAEIKYYNKDIDCLKFLKKAIQSCEHEKTKKIWINNYESWKNDSQNW